MPKPAKRKPKSRKKRRILVPIRNRVGHAKPAAQETVAKKSAFKFPVRVHLLDNFKHIDLSEYGKHLRSLKEQPDQLLVLSEKKRSSAQYYLSTLDAVKKSFRSANKAWPTSRKSSDPRVAQLLKEVAHEIPVLSSVQFSGATSLLAGKHLTRQSPVLVQVENAKPVRLVVSGSKTRQSDLSSDIKNMLLKSVPSAAPKSAAALVDDLTKEVASSAGIIMPDSVQEHDDGTVIAGFEELVLPGESTKPAPISTASPAPSLPASSAPNGAEKVPGAAGAGSKTKPEPSGIESGTPLPKEQNKAAASQAMPVFPEIFVSDDHPVQGSVFDVSVALNFKKSDTTSGCVHAPADQNPHRFDVHLLLGKTSRWGELIFQRPVGTTQTAIFKDVQAPILDGSEKEIDGHPIIDLYVNFYLESRWCGEALRRIEVLPSKDSQKLAVLQTPEAPPWRKDLHVELGTEPPDLLIRIKQIGALDFEWSLLSPFKVFSKPLSEMRTSLKDTPYRFVKDNFEPFSGCDLSTQQIEDLNENCDSIFQIAPLGFREAYREFCAEVAADPKKRFHTIQFVSDEPFIPWELMRVSDPDNRFPPEILAVKHSVGRWMASDSCQLRNHLEIKKIAVSASDYKALNLATLPHLPWVAEERRFLESPPYGGEDIPLRLQSLTDFLRKGSAEIVHFSCHGKTDVDAPRKATLSMEDGVEVLKASTVATPEVRAGEGRSQPIVFLNACQAGAAGQFLSMVFGWPQAFLQMGATACVAPFWRVMDDRAKKVAEAFYQGALAGDDAGLPRQLGEVLRRIRAQWKDEKSLTYLGYILYGDPTTVLTWKSPPVIASASPAVGSASEVPT